MVGGGWWANPLQTLPQGLVLTFDFDFDPDPDPELDNFHQLIETPWILRHNIAFLTFKVDRGYFIALKFFW